MCGGRQPAVCLEISPCSAYRPRAACEQRIAGDRSSLSALLESLGQVPRLGTLPPRSCPGFCICQLEAAVIVNTGMLPLVLLQILAGAVATGPHRIIVTYDRNVASSDLGAMTADFTRDSTATEPQLATSIRDATQTIHVYPHTNQQTEIDRIIMLLAVGSSLRTYVVESISDHAALTATSTSTPTPTRIDWSPSVPSPSTPGIYWLFLVNCNSSLYPADRAAAELLGSQPTVSTAKMTVAVHGSLIVYTIYTHDTLTIADMLVTQVASRTAKGSVISFGHRGYLVKDVVKGSYATTASELEPLIRTVMGDGKLVANPAIIATWNVTLNKPPADAAAAQLIVDSFAAPQTAHEPLTTVTIHGDVVTIALHEHRFASHRKTEYKWMIAIGTELAPGYTATAVAATFADESSDNRQFVIIIIIIVVVVVVAAIAALFVCLCPYAAYPTHQPTCAALRRSLLVALAIPHAVRLRAIYNQSSAVSPTRTPLRVPNPSHPLRPTDRVVSTGPTGGPTGAHRPPTAGLCRRRSKHSRVVHDV